MKKPTLLFCILASVLLIACQKELTDEGTQEYCNVTSITVRNGLNGTVTARYDFEYDTIHARPIMLRYRDFVQNSNRTIYPRYVKDSVYLDQNSSLALDASKRISVLTEFNAQPGITHGYYYYSYDKDGQLKERVIDDAYNTPQYTNFEYKDGNLVNYRQDYLGHPQALFATLTYAPAPKLKGLGQFGLVELFPELLLYMPCIKMGKMPEYPVSEIKSLVQLPNRPISSFSNKYGTYTLTPEGFLSTFQSNVQRGSSAPQNMVYEFSYRCFH